MMRIPFSVFLDVWVCLLGLFVQRRVGVACGTYGYFKTGASGVEMVLSPGFFEIISSWFSQIRMLDCFDCFDLPKQAIYSNKKKYSFKGLTPNAVSLRETHHHNPLSPK